MSTPTTTTVEAAPKAFAPWEWILAFRYLRSKRKETGVGLITAIAFWAIALAIAVLIIVMSIMNGFRAELLSKILGFEAHAYVTGEATYDGAWQATAERLEAVPGVVEVIPTVSSLGVIRAAGLRGAQVKGIEPDRLRQLPLVSTSIDQGSLDDFGKIGLFEPDPANPDALVEGPPPDIVIGSRLATALGVQAGDVVDLLGFGGTYTPFGGQQPISKPFRVGAIFTVGMSEYDELFAFIPMEVAQAFYGRGLDIDALEIKVENPDPDRMNSYIRPIIEAAGPSASVSDWRQANTSFWGALQVERNMMRIVMLLIVSIAALNIISALVMLVKNKERDIAILRTIGASQGAVMRVFLISGASIGVLASPTGVLLGVLFCWNIEHIQKFIDGLFGVSTFPADVYFLSSLPAKLDWTEVLIVFLFTLIVSIVVTIIPSWRASRTDPVETLRYE